MVQYLLEEEEKRIVEIISTRNEDVVFGSDNNISLVSEIELNAIFKHVHSRILLDLAYTFLCAKSKEYAQSIINHYFFKSSDENNSIIRFVEIDKIPQYCESLHIAFLNSKFEMKKGRIVRTRSKEQLIDKGAVYTQSKIAYEIVSNTINNLDNFNSDISVLDFACGTGRFYETIVEVLTNKGIDIENAVLNNIFALDIDEDALNITRLKAISFLKEITEEKIEKISDHIIMKNGLLRYNPLDEQDIALNYNDFEGKVNYGFDAIVSNPPYLVLKANKSKAGLSTADNIAQMVTYFRKSGIYKYSIEGMLNLYQLSIESMLLMLKSGGEMGIICPSTLFADLSATKLRKYLLSSNKVRAIKFYAEKIPLFENVSQATNIFYLKKSGKTDLISITENDITFNVEYSAIQALFPDNNEIPNISNDEWNVLIKLSKCKKLKTLTNVRNRRGELDLTFCKKYITTTETPYRLVRGNMIGEKSIKNINGEFVKEDFVGTRSKDYLSFDFNQRRLICQQISNGGCSKRLKFIFCSSSDILANSCNYISSDQESLKKLYILLNSSLLNWRFKVTSSNNHINNYELDELPIIDLSEINGNIEFDSQKELDIYVGKLYGLTEKEIQLVAN